MKVTYAVETIKSVTKKYIYTETLTERLETRYRVAGTQRDGRQTRLCSVITDPARAEQEAKAMKARWNLLECHVEEYTEKVREYKNHRYLRKRK